MRQIDEIGNPDVEIGGDSRTERLRAVMRHDLPASLVVFLVALPLSLGIAIASDAPVLAGLIAAIVGGIVGGALGRIAVTGKRSGRRPDGDRRRFDC